MSYTKYPKYDKWMKYFKSSSHPKIIKEVIWMGYNLLYSHFMDNITSGKEMQEELSELFKMASTAGKIMAGRLLVGDTVFRKSMKYTQPFRKGSIKNRSIVSRDNTILVKKGSLSEHISRIDPTPGVIQTITKAVEMGQGPGSAISKLEQHYGSYNKAKSVVRTTMLNYYTANYLAQWRDSGLELVKRVEMHDHKTCKICRSLNGGVYSIDDLIEEEFPLTFMTHPNCRGSYTPYMAKLSRVRPMTPILKTIRLNGNVSEYTPLEYAGLIRYIFMRTKFPFKISYSFDKKAPLAVFKSPSELVIGLFNIGDKDIREVIIVEKAKIIWPEWRTKFIKEYMPYVQAGLVHPTRKATTPKDVFIDGYTSLILKQLDEGMEWYWWGKNFIKNV